LDWNKLLKDAENIANKAIQKEIDKDSWKTLGKIPKVENYISDEYFPSTFRIAYRQYWLISMETEEYKPVAIYKSGYGDKLIISQRDFENLKHLETFINHWFPQLTFIQIKEFK
jgi:hypothetical protein